MTDTRTSPSRVGNGSEMALAVMPPPRFAPKIVASPPGTILALNDAELTIPPEATNGCPTALIVNFPSNPTAYLADLDFYREIVAFARRHEIWILSDLAYAEIYFGDKVPPSLLQVPGAKDIAVEPGAAEGIEE